MTGIFIAILYFLICMFWCTYIIMKVRIIKESILYTFFRGFVVGLILPKSVFVLSYTTVSVFWAVVMFVGKYIN